MDDSSLAARQRFLVEVEALRPDLYRYCRYLTRSPWDAEDLVQDTLAKAFVSLADKDVATPRAWLFRVASNAWLNRVRHAEVEHHHGSESKLDVPGIGDVARRDSSRDTREAAGTLLAQLAPQERAAIVLKDVFDFSLDDIATMLSTTEGAIKAALHRGRGKLAEPEDPAPNPVERELLDAFITAFNARDLERVAALLTGDVVVELPGLYAERGLETAKRGMLFGALFGCDDPAILAASSPALRVVREKAGRADARMYRGAPVVLMWWTDAGRDAVRALMRVETKDDRISRMQTYLHTPDVIAEVCKELGVPYELVGYGM